MSNFPASQDIFTTLDGQDDILSQHPNVRGDVIEAIEGFVGISGSSQSYNATLLSLLLSNYAGGRCYKKSDTEIYVGSFAGIIANVAGSVRRLRVKNAVTTLDAAALDTGVFAIDTFYYIYATADTASTEPLYIISSSPDVPAGYTHYKKIGWFYNEGAGALNIASGFVGNMKDGSDNPNTARAESETSANTTSAVFAPMPDMSVKFVSSGRPVLILGTNFGHMNSDYHIHQLEVAIDGTNKPLSRAGVIWTKDPGLFLCSCDLSHMEELPAGEHTIVLQWRVAHETYQCTSLVRKLIVKEL